MDSESSEAAVIDNSIKDIVEAICVTIVIVVYLILRFR